MFIFNKKTDFLRYLCIHTHMYNYGGKKYVVWLFTQDTVLTGIIPKVQSSLDSPFQHKSKRYLYQPIQILNSSYWRRYATRHIFTSKNIVKGPRLSKIISLIGVVHGGFNCLATVIKKKEQILLWCCCFSCFVAFFPP